MWFAGEYVEARDHFERALSLFQSGRDDDLAFRFGQDAGVAAMVFLAIASWPLGNVERAISLVDDAHERIASVGHVQTHAYAKYHAAWFELMRGDRARARRTLPRSPALHVSMICRIGERSGRFSRASRTPNAARLARVSATCAGAQSCSCSRTVCFSMGS